VAQHSGLSMNTESKCENVVFTNFIVFKLVLRDLSSIMSRGLGFSAEGVPNQGWKLSVTSITFVVLAGLTTAARCATRFHARQLGSDDYTIVCSLVSVFHQS